MISHMMLGLILVVTGFAFVAAGTIMWIIEPATPVPGRFCSRKEPIYCYKTLHGILFDAGWPLAIIGGLIMLLYRKEKLWQ